MNPIRQLHGGRTGFILVVAILAVALIIRAGATGAFILVFIIPVLWGARAPADKFKK